MVCSNYAWVICSVHNCCVGHMVCRECACRLEGLLSCVKISKTEHSLCMAASWRGPTLQYRLDMCVGLGFLRIVCFCTQ